jgi:hypothetical protein
MAAPVKTLQKAQTLARAAKPSTILLRAGTYYLGQTLALTPQDSGLTIQAYNGERAVLSGAMPMGPVKWEPYNVSSGSAATMTPLMMNINLVEGCSQGVTIPA